MYKKKTNFKLDEKNTRFLLYNHYYYFLMYEVIK